MGNIPTDFHDRINDAVAGYFIDGKFDETLNNAVDNAIDGIIKDMFRYGTVQKQIQTAIEEKIQLDLSQLEVPEFNKLAVELIQKKVVEQLKIASHDVMLENIEKMFKPAEKEITFSHFLDEFIGDMWQDGCDCDADKVVYHIDRNDWGGITLKVWRGERFTTGLFDHKERENEPELNLYFSGIDDTDDATLAIIRSPDVKDDWGTSNYGFDAQVFLWYCAKTVFKDINKEDEGETIIYSYEYRN